MKCISCNHKKGKRRCLRYNNELICYNCCGRERNYMVCNTECEYFPIERYQLLQTNGIELTEVGRGKVILFSESLYLPNISDCLCINVNKININIKNPIFISINMEFEIKENIKERKVNDNEVYLKDSWKRNDKMLPFLQIYTLGTGEVYNESLLCENTEEKLIIENNHADTWLPYSTITNEKISDDDRSKLNILNEPKNALYPVSRGKHFIGKNNTFLANIKINKKYTLKFDIYYDSIHNINNNILVNLGLFFPFKRVNYSDYKVNLLDDYIFNQDSEIQLLLPFEEKEIKCFLTPLENMNFISSPQYVKHSFNNLENTFHYDRFAIFNHSFYLNNKSDIAYSTTSNVPIFTGIYDSFNNIYENEYAPISVTLFNNHSEIKKYKIETEIYGLSYKNVKEIYVEPYSISNTKIAPQLIDSEVNKITTNTKKEIYIKVLNESGIIYENTQKCLVYPKEVFVEKLENGRKDWKIDFRSFLARWITPNSKSIDIIISQATREEEIVGGISSDSLRTEKDIKKIYDTLTELKYTIRALSFSDGAYHTQRISLPENTVNLKSGNCIDLSILLASCFEAIKLKTYIVLIPGHAMVMVELNSELICIESTCLGNKEYYEAKEIGINKYKQHFNENKEPLDNYSYILDISNARKCKIFPMN